MYVVPLQILTEDFIIFGVDDRWIEIRPRIYQQVRFGDKLKAESEIIFNMKHIEISKQNKYLYGFEIPKSDLRHHTNCDPEKRKFWKSTQIVGFFGFKVQTTVYCFDNPPLRP